jgi:hypothetical protein
MLLPGSTRIGFKKSEQALVVGDTAEKRKALSVDRLLEEKLISEKQISGNLLSGNRLNERPAMRRWHDRCCFLFRIFTSLRAEQSGVKSLIDSSPLFLNDLKINWA